MIKKGSYLRMEGKGMKRMETIGKREECRKGDSKEVGINKRKA